MKYFLFEKSAVETLINNAALQSMEFSLSKNFVDYLQGKKDDFLIKDISHICDKDGIIFCGKESTKTFLLFDLEKCRILEKTDDAELLIVLQKSFRFAVRFWNRQAFTNCEKIFKSKTVIFPFPFSMGSAYRIVLERNPIDRRLNARGINNCLLAYKYGEEGASSSEDENPDLVIFRKGGENYLEHIQELKRRIVDQKCKYESKEYGSDSSIHVYVSDNMISSVEFKFLDYKRQLENLTLSQSNIINCKDMDSPIRVEGPAGTGKTAALVLRAIKLLLDAEKNDQELFIAFFTHSKSTESVVNQMILHLAKTEWLNLENPRKIRITTLQGYCTEYIGVKDTQVIDLDASEAKQYQLLLIQEAYKKVNGAVFNTYKYLMSEEAVTFYENEEENKVILMLQHEFSIRIKGMAEGDFERYKKLNSQGNGIPLIHDEDKEYVYRIFKEYQQSLEVQSVYDTDDIILEALARLNAPLWRRARAKEGIDYLLVDEMHLFNLNEQQVFHFLTKDGEQQKIPICFALDYGQIVGKRGNIKENYIESTLSVGQTLRQEFITVFRSSQQIAELCASITASGALLFDGFINPYKYCESSFTAREEEMCETPQLLMYENDAEMKRSLERHIKHFVNKYKCKPYEIALVFFDEEMLLKNFTQSVGKYSVNFINGRENSSFETDTSKIICTLPDYISGLEFKCVILVAVDEGRVPQSGLFDISSSFLKYSALNKLYLSCSRAQYSVLILGNKLRGVSSCLQHSLARETIIQGNAE
ncbi:MAG: UvrD-helicase domain-containing protein [Clostridium sp.]|nr:UvrD-helicase domain-containing protein [Clostridium sp.]